ncbi:MAG: CBS domain-containing protein [Acidimicrobiia bacterium]|nr:CBS domain-containing protein [Acidimicrobiia bacterium]
MKTVEQVLGHKGGAVYGVRPDDTVFRALEMMAEKGVGALLVLEDDELVGILSERDYARKGILMDRSSHETKVSELMTARVLCVGLETSVDQCMALMTEKRIRHLPVLEGGHVVGVISIGDVVRTVISEQEFIISELERYINS